MKYISIHIKNANGRPSWVVQTIAQIPRKDKYKTGNNRGKHVKTNLIQENPRKKQQKFL